jgi:protein SCO1/2
LEPPVPKSTLPAEPTPQSGKEERWFFAIILTLAVVVGLGGWFAATAFSQPANPLAIPPDKPRQLEDFALTDSTGRDVTRGELDGKVLAVSFLFTSCSMTCPQISRHMADLQQLTAEAPDVRLVSLALDPRSDSPPVLAKFGAWFGANTNRWLLLTGNKAELHRLIGTSFLATETNNPVNAMPGNFAGVERIVVVDKRGRIRSYFDGVRDEAPAAVAREIDKLRKEK